MHFTSFLPAISKDALKKISAEVRSWRLHRHMEMTSADIARWINPNVRGWMNYYGAFRRSELYPLLRRINTYLMRWLMNKYSGTGPGRKPSGPGQTRPQTGRGTSPTGTG